MKFSPILGRSFFHRLTSTISKVRFLWIRHESRKIDLRTRRWLVSTLSTAGMMVSTNSAEAMGVSASSSTIVYVPSISFLRDLAGAADLAISGGYYRPGDGAGGTFAWRPSDTDDEDGGIIFASSTRGVNGRWRRIGSIEHLNVKWFGARGDSKTDDSRAFEAAHVVAIRNSMAVYVPPGRYAIKKVPLFQAGGHVNWTGAPNLSYIELYHDDYFLTSSGKVSDTHVSGLSIIGGKGAFRFSNEGENVSGHHVFVDCSFQGYKECAIGNNSSDQPYLKVSRCLFHSSKDSLAIGIAWGGNIDRLSIDNCTFLLNAYHLKIGPRISGSATITNNDFISFYTGVRKADIWLVPNRFAGNAGVCLTIRDNKFGNEAQAENDCRVLVATEDMSSGADRLSRHHAAIWVGENVYLQGLQFLSNRISGVSPLTAPFMRAYIPNLLRFIIRDNIFDGGRYSSFVEFMGGQAGLVDGKINANWLIDLPPSETGTMPFSKTFSNRPVGIVFSRNDAPDPYAGIGISGMTETASVTMLATLDDLQELRANVSTLSHAEKGTSTLELSFQLATQVYHVRLAPITKNRLSWFDMRAKVSEASVENGFVVRVFCARTGVVATEKEIRLSGLWRTIRVPFFMPNEGSSDEWVASINAIGLGKTSTVLSIEHFNIYHAFGPVRSDHIATTGTGGWNGSHIVLGKHHIWIDLKEKLRISSSEPRFDDDGREIGG